MKMKLGLMPLKPGVPVPVAGSKVPKLVNAATVPRPVVDARGRLSHRDRRAQARIRDAGGEGGLGDRLARPVGRRVEEEAPEVGTADRQPAQEALLLGGRDVDRGRVEGERAGSVPTGNWAKAPRNEPSGATR